MPTNVTFEQQLMSDVVKQVLTPDKIKAMAAKMAPQIEKEFEKQITAAIKGWFDDDYYVRELIDNDREIHNVIKDKVRAAFGVVPADNKTNTKAKR